MKKNKIEFQFIDKQDYDSENLNYKILENPQYLLNKFSKVTKTSIFIYDYYKQEIIYLMYDNLLFPKDEIEKNQKLDLNMYLSKIEEKDKNLVAKINKKSFEFLKAQKAEDFKNLVLNYNICLNINKKRDYLVDVKVNIMEADSLGNIWLAMFVIKKSEYQNYILPFFINVETKELTFFQNPKLAKYDFNSKKLETINELASKANQKEIADKLGIGVDGLSTRLQSIYNDLNVKNRVQAVKKIESIMRH